MGEFSSETAFTRAVAPLRAELRAHCYRMLGSIHDADDAVQEALLRAWRGLSGFEGRSALRTWLYTVATRTCLDLIEQRGRRALPVDLGPPSEQVVLEAPRADVAWLGPCPDFPAASYEQREAVELAFVAACRHLPGNQRAALLLFDVLGFSAAEIAAIMETSVTSVNSALARARRTISAHVPASTQQQTLRTLGDARLQELVTGFATALTSGDVDGLVRLLTEDVTWSMPPLPHWYRGRTAVVDFAYQVPMTRCPSWRFRLTSANAQPAVAFYLGGSATAAHEAWSITVLTLRGDRIRDLTSFLCAEHFPAFGLPASVTP
ncbi:sigma-70 family RNA polymerase sigma factor [Amycolatopsis halotolerans]|uniref:Sigma-70 family RNA polymerase sigma factor n=1 Tax=Amycolatopsis halotolerans TaxID=330083 RepID=A0ABV7QDI1_9PSEU